MSRVYVARAEMRLSRPDVEPLRLVPATPDPLAAFERVLEQMDTARGERAEIVVDLLPASTRERHKFRARQRKHEIIALVDNLTGTKQGTRDALMGRPPGNSLSLPFYRNSAATRFGLDDVDQVARRVAVPTALFYVQVLMRASSYDHHRAHEHLDALIACWEIWAGRNRFRPAGVNVLGLFFVGADTPFLRRWFDYRLETGRFHPWKRKLLSAADVAAWITPPTTTQTQTRPRKLDALQRHGLADIAETLLLPDDDRQSGAEATPEPELEPEPGPDIDDLVDDDGARLLYGIGRRGGAVDGIVRRLAAPTVRAGAGAVILDADGSRRDVDTWRPPGRVVMPLLGDDDGRPVPGWNPVLPPAPGAPVDRGAVAVRALIDALHSTDITDAVALLDASLRTLRTLAGSVPADLAPTLFQIPRLVDDPDWRKPVLPLLDAPTRRVWTDVVSRMPRRSQRRVVNLVERLGDDPVAAALLGQPDTTYDPTALLAQPATVILTAAPASIDDVLAGLLWFDAASAARALAETTTGPPPLVVATATHRYSGGPAGLFTNDLAATVQAGAAMVLLTDRPDATDTNTRHALRTAATAVAVDDIDTGLAAAADWLRVDDVVHLRSRLDELDDATCVVAAARDGWRLRTLNVTRMTPPDTGGRTRMPAATPGGRRLAETRARLDTLEERIAEHLARPAPDADAPDDPAAERDDGEHHGNVVKFDASRRKRRPRE